MRKNVHQLYNCSLTLPWIAHFPMTPDPKALLLDNPIFCSYLCPKVMLLILPFVRGFQEQALCRHNWDFFLGTSANVRTHYQHTSRAGSVKGEFI